jgi:hypothetical protein
MAPIPASAPAQHSSQETRLEEVRAERARVAVSYTFLSMLIHINGSQTQFYTSDLGLDTM